MFLKEITGGARDTQRDHIILKYFLSIFLLGNIKSIKRCKEEREVFCESCIKLPRLMCKII